MKPGSNPAPGWVQLVLGSLAHALVVRVLQLTTDKEIYFNSSLLLVMGNCCQEFSILLQPPCMIPVSGDLHFCSWGKTAGSQYTHTVGSREKRSGRRERDRRGSPHQAGPGWGRSHSGPWAETEGAAGAKLAGSARARGAEGGVSRSREAGNSVPGPWALRGVRVEL